MDGSHWVEVLLWSVHSHNPRFLPLSELMSKMPAEEVRRMQELAASVVPPSFSGVASVTSGAPSTSSSTIVAPQTVTRTTASSPASMMPGLTPEMTKMAADMMAKMKPEDMEKMAKMAADMGMGPGPGVGSATGGMPAFTPEMMKQASSMMANMKPEDMKRMQVGSPKACDAIAC